MDSATGSSPVLIAGTSHRTFIFRMVAIALRSYKPLTRIEGLLKEVEIEQRSCYKDWDTPFEPYADRTVRSALIVRAPWADLLVTGKKRWELRTRQSHKRELIGIIEAGKKAIIGVVQIVDSLGPLSNDELRRSEHMHMIPAAMLDAFQRHRTAWVMARAHQFEVPIPCVVPNGAQLFVTLDAGTARRLSDQLAIDQEIGTESHAFITGSQATMLPECLGV
jgi:hypothetical protein